MYSKSIKNYCETTIFKRFMNKWIQPTGLNTNIKVYNCVVKDKVPLILPNKDRISWYTCGPTVYDSAHIGHASCYIKFDIIQRILKKFFNYNIISVMNITDVDDKIIRRAMYFKVPPQEIAKRFEKEFWLDMKNLNISKPDIVVRVTDHIPIITQFIQKVVEDNKAYLAADGSVYFNLNINESVYGKLVPVNYKRQTENAFKKSLGDFAMWKGAKPEEPCWKSSLGNGRPGWHSECSALASAVFGNQIDIHAGGIDLKFPHHENEEAISCAYHQTNQWVNYWLHAGHLTLGDKEVKMSKSLDNCIYIQELLNERKSASDVFRMACVMSHYRANMEYSKQMLDTAEAQLNKFITFLNDCESYCARTLPPSNIDANQLLQKMSETIAQVDEALKDDFNTAKAIKVIMNMVTFTNKMIHTSNFNPSTTNLNDCVIVSLIGSFVKEYFEMFGFTSNVTEREFAANENLAFSIVDVLTVFRQNVRTLALQNNNSELLKYCDGLRNELKMYGIEIKDHGKLSSWTKV